MKVGVKKQQLIWLISTHLLCVILNCTSMNVVEEGINGDISPQCILEGCAKSLCIPLSY